MNKKLAVYFVMAYLFSWIVFVPLALNANGVIFLFPDDAEHARQMDLWHAFGGFGPLLSALITLWIFGRRDIEKFYKSYSLSRINSSGWAMAFSPILLFCVAILVNKFVDGDWINPVQFFRKNDLLDPANFAMWFFPLVTYGFGEEGGWRGFALPELQSKYSALTATVILTLFWLGWHLPSFFYRYNLSGTMLTGFILGLFAGAVLLTFLFNYTRGSLLAVSVWHFTFNLVSMIGTELVVSATMSTLIMIVAFYLIIKYGKKDLSPYPKTAYMNNAMRII